MRATRERTCACSGIQVFRRSGVQPGRYETHSQHGGWSCSRRASIPRTWSSICGLWSIVAVQSPFVDRVFSDRWPLASESALGGAEFDGDGSDPAAGGVMPSSAADGAVGVGVSMTVTPGAATVTPGAVGVAIGAGLTLANRPNRR